MLEDNLFIFNFKNMKNSNNRTIIYLISAIFFPLTIFIVWNFALSKIPSSYGIKNDLINKNINDVELINVGTSREFDGINPELFPIKSLNLANNGQDIYYDVEIIKVAVQKLNSLKYILFGIYPNTLIRDINDTARATYYYRVYGIKPKNKSIFDPLRLIYSNVYIPSQGIAWLLFNADVNITSTINNWGWTNHRQLKSKIDASAEKELAILHSNQMTDAKNEETIQKNITLLKSLKALIESKKIKIIFFTVPTLPVYHKFFIKNGIEKYQTIINDLTVHFNTKHYNYIDDQRFYENEFADGSHLNILGAKKFSNIIKNEILLRDLIKR